MNLDVCVIGQLFSEIFNKFSQSPKFYLEVKRPSNWEIYFVEDPCKRMRDFLPHYRGSNRMKKRIYYKCERLGQSLVTSEILANYFLNHLDQIHHDGDGIQEINLQWFTVKGHSNPYDKEEEIYLMDHKQRVCVVHLKTTNGKDLYLDICGTQIDIHKYSKGSDYPFVVYEKLEKKKQLAKKENPSIIVADIEEAIPIRDHQHYEEYIQKLHLSDDDDAELLSVYHKRLEKELSRLVEERT